MKPSEKAIFRSLIKTIGQIMVTEITNGGLNETC